MTLIRKPWGRGGHVYSDDGQPVTGATTILSRGYPKPALQGYAAKMAGQLVLNRWDELCGMEPSERQLAVARAHLVDSGEKMERGKTIHALAELVITGEDVEVPLELEAEINAYARFLDAWDVQPVLVERPGINRRSWYAGTFDLVADLRGTRWLLDLKSGKEVWEDVALQLAAYRNFEAVLVAPGVEEPMPEVDRCGVIHVKPDSCELVPVEVDADTFAAFLQVQAVGNWIKSAKDASPVGLPIQPLRSAS